VPELPQEVKCKQRNSPDKTTQRNTQDNRLISAVTGRSYLIDGIFSLASVFSNAQTKKCSFSQVLRRLKENERREDVQLLRCLLRA
jgi:hypothetical protein